METKRIWWLGLVLAVAQINAASAALTTNSWTNSASSFWQTASNWSAGIPTNSNAAVLITNASTKTVTINSGTPVANLTISNLTVRGFGAGINSLQLTNTAPNELLIRNGLAIGTNAVLTLTNAMLRVAGISGGDLTIDGTVNLRDGGLVAATNVDTIVGNTA